MPPKFVAEADTVWAPGVEIWTDAALLTATELSPVDVVGTARPSTVSETDVIALAVGVDEVDVN